MLGKLDVRLLVNIKEIRSFRRLFPEIMPDSSCQWSADTMTHKRNYNGITDPNQGEGTYEFTGVDAALTIKTL